MTQLLMWDIPVKKMTTEEWANNGGFDGGPTGGYVPNMSAEDAARWRAKLVGKTTSSPQVEIRRTMVSQVLLIVNLGQGYQYKGYNRQNTQGVNVHFSSNGPLQMSFEDMQELNQVIQEAKAYLEGLSTVNKE